MTATWTLDEAIATRWTEAGLDASFRAYWSDSGLTEYPTLSEGSAPAGHPGPYCVYEKLKSVPETNESGETDETSIKQLRVPVLFRIHARHTATKAAKTIAQELAKLVATAFDWSYGYLHLWPDSHVRTDRVTDYWEREGNKEYAWVVEYSFVIETERRFSQITGAILEEETDEDVLAEDVDDELPILIEDE